MNQELAAFHVLADALADCEHLLLHFRGPVCDLSVRPVTADGYILSTVLLVAGSRDFLTLV